MVVVFIRQWTKNCALHWPGLGFNDDGLVMTHAVENAQVW